jgi:hypothetical protein
MIKSGEKYANESGSKSPLMYKWHDSQYREAAYVVSGLFIFCARFEMNFFNSKK